MEKVTNIAEICNLIRNKLIEYGVQEHTAWYDYNQNYRPVIYFFSTMKWNIILRSSLAIRNFDMLPSR